MRRSTVPPFPLSVVVAVLFTRERNKAHKTQAEVAEASGVTQVQVSKFERGLVGDVGLNLFARYCDTLELDPGTLVKTAVGIMAAVDAMTDAVGPNDMKDGLHWRVHEAAYSRHGKALGLSFLMMDGLD